MLLERFHAKGRQAEIPTTRDDPAIGRWGSVDPLNQDHSPYIYCANNPATSIDPTGLAWFYYHAAGDSTAGYHWHDGDEITIVDQDGNKGTLKGKTGFFAYNSRGVYNYFGNSKDEKYFAWQDDLGFYSYYRVGMGDGAEIYQVQTLDNLKNIWKYVVTGITANVFGKFFALRGGGVTTTAHGVERIAGEGATRGGVLNQVEIATTNSIGRTLTQADGAIVKVQEIGGRYNITVTGERGLITTFKNLSQKSLEKLARNYGWK